METQRIKDGVVVALVAVSVAWLGGRLNIPDPVIQAVIVELMRALALPQRPTVRRPEDQ
jgi:hypothetical protein